MKIKEATLLANAHGLLSEQGRIDWETNPEYTRAILELVGDTLELPADHDERVNEVKLRITEAGAKVGAMKHTKTYEVPYYPGNGTEVMLQVSYIADFPVGADGTCAFCHGDPSAVTSSPDSWIGTYMSNHPFAQACPCCEGRPS